MHFDRGCPALSRSNNLREERIDLPAKGTLADFPISEAHCHPKGEIGAYMSAALRLCELAEKMPSIGDRLGIRLQSLAQTTPTFEAYYNDVDIQAVGAARAARDELKRVQRHGTGWNDGGLSSACQALVQQIAAGATTLADALYDRALEQARSSTGRRCLGRMLAATCVLSGRLPRQYAAIYEQFRETVARALLALRTIDVRHGAGLSDVLEDRERFDFARRWLEAMVETGDPGRVGAALRDEMNHWNALNDPSLRKLHDLALDIGTSAAVAYLDGLRARGEEPILVLAAAHASAHNWYSPLTDLQWDIFPSATCRLRGQGRGEPSEDARVAVVPRLWVEALSKADEPSMGGDYVILAYDLDPILQTNAVCTAVAKALGRACRADVLSCRRWSAIVPSRIAAERAAREAAASVLIRQRDDLFRPHA